jgi:hypothetical protein
MPKVKAMGGAGAPVMAATDALMPEAELDIMTVKLNSGGVTLDKVIIKEVMELTRNHIVEHRRWKVTGEKLNGIYGTRSAMCADQVRLKNLVVCGMTTERKELYLWYVKKEYKKEDIKDPEVFMKKANAVKVVNAVASIFQRLCNYAFDVEDLLYTPSDVKVLQAKKRKLDEEKKEKKAAAQMAALEAKAVADAKKATALEAKAAAKAAAKKDGDGEAEEDGDDGEAEDDGEEEVDGDGDDEEDGDDAKSYKSTFSQKDVDNFIDAVDKEAEEVELNEDVLEKIKKVASAAKSVGFKDDAKKKEFDDSLIALMKSAVGMLIQANERGNTAMNSVGPSLKESDSKIFLATVKKEATDLLVEMEGSGSSVGTKTKDGIWPKLVTFVAKLKTTITVTGNLDVKKTESESETDDSSVLAAATMAMVE